MVIRLFLVLCIQSRYPDARARSITLARRVSVTS